MIHMPVGLGCQRVAGRRIVAEELRLSLGEIEVPVQEHMVSQSRMKLDLDCSVF